MDILYIVIIVCGIIGFGISAYIYQKKVRKGRHLVCPTGEGCDVVVESKYGKVFGIENSLLGMGYYAFIALIYIGFITSEPFRNIYLVYAGKILTTGAFAFSAYLIGIQAVVLEKWCIWCVSSAILTAIIFVLTVLLM